MIAVAAGSIPLWTPASRPPALQQVSKANAGAGLPLKGNPVKKIECGNEDA